MEINKYSGIQMTISFYGFLFRRVKLGVRAAVRHDQIENNRGRPDTAEIQRRVGLRAEDVPAGRRVSFLPRILGALLARVHREWHHVCDVRSAVEGLQLEQSRRHA